MSTSILSDLSLSHGAASELSVQRPSLFFTAVEQSSVAMSITDPQARIVYTNQAFRQQTGYTQEELAGRNPNLLASQQTPRSIYREMWGELLEGKPWNGQLINQRKDGSLYLAEISISPVFSPLGEIEHYLAMHKDISESYALVQRLRNQMTLIAAVLNNIPAPVIVVDEHHQVVMDNLAYKTLCADCGGRELLAEMGYPREKTTLESGALTAIVIRGVTRWFSFGSWALPEVNEEASRYFTGTAPPRRLIMITDCSEQHKQREQQRLDRLKQQLTNGKLLAAIRESLDAAMIQLNCPLNMLAAALRLNPDMQGNIALEAAWREGQSAVERLKACRPSLDQDATEFWPVDTLLHDVMALYQTRFASLGELFCTSAMPRLQGFGQRNQILASLSLWFDRSLSLAADLPPFSLLMRLHASVNEHWLCLQVEDNIPQEQVRYAPQQAAFTPPGHGMELRLIQTLIAHHQGMIDLSPRSGGGTSLLLRLPLPAIHTGGA